MSERIIQITPSNDFAALCENKDGAEFWLSVVCFALKEISDETGTHQSVVPMTWAEKHGVIDINKIAKILAISHRR